MIKVKDFVKTGLINFRSLEEIPSNPQLAFGCISSIVLDIALIDTHLSKQQFGFRKNRGTVDAIFIV